jgi:hypothetical protein
MSSSQQLILYDPNMSTVLRGNIVNSTSTQGARTIFFDEDPSSSDTAVSSSSPISHQSTLNGNESPRSSDPGDLSLTPRPDENSSILPGDENFTIGYIRIRTPELPQPWTRPKPPAQALPKPTMLPPKRPFEAPPLFDKPFKEWPVRPRQRKYSSFIEQTVKRRKLSSSSGYESYESPSPPEHEIKASYLVLDPVTGAVTEDVNPDYCDTDGPAPPSPRPSHTTLPSDAAATSSLPFLMPMDEDDLEEDEDSICLPNLFPTGTDDSEELCPEATESEAADIEMSEEMALIEEEDARLASKEYGRYNSPPPSNDTDMARKQFQYTRNLERKKSHQAQDARIKEARELYEAKARESPPEMEVKPTLTSKFAQHNTA